VLRPLSDKCFFSIASKYHVAQYQNLTVEALNI